MAWSLDDLREAVSYITGVATEKLQQLKELAIWVWEVLQGDFKKDQDVSHITANTAISIGVTATGIGILVAWLMDLRDLIANAYHIYDEARKDGELDFSKVSGILWFALIATLIGVIPALGDLVKGVFRIIIICFRKAAQKTHLTDIVKLFEIAVDDAIPYIRELLDKPLIKKWLAKQHWSRPFREMAKVFKQIKPMITQKYLMSLFDDMVGKLKEIVDAVIKYLPSGASKKVESLYQTLDKIRTGLDHAIGNMIKPFQDCLDVIIIKFEKIDYTAYTAKTGAINEHYFGRISKETNPKAWQKIREDLYLKQAKEAPFEGIALDRSADIITKGVKRGWPEIYENSIKSFHQITAEEIKGPVKLYRVVDPDSRADGLFWLHEEDFTKLTSRKAWRSNSAVKEEWNANGQYVEYEIKKGETLKVWEGPAASQPYDEGLWYEGGGVQIVFYPSPERVSARKATGWGYIERDEHLLNDRILVDLSGNTIKNKE